MTKPIPGAATDAERREALELAQRLESLGREAKVEPFEARPAYALVYLTLALLAIVGSVASVSLPIAGAALAGVAAILTFGEGTGMFMLARRLTGMRASQNVVSEEDGGKPGTLVLAARYNADRAGAQRMRFLPVFFWAMVAVLLCAIARIAGLDGVALTAVQFVPTVLLIVSIPLLADIALSDFGDANREGVETVLALAERYGGGLEHFDVWVLFAGAHPLGMRAFLKRRRKELAKERTVLLNVDDGDGVRYSRREGLLFGSRSHVQLRQLCEEIAEDSEEFEAESFVYRSTPNPYPSITTSPELCAELMERLDAAIGPELSEQPVPSR